MYKDSKKNAFEDPLYDDPLYKDPVYKDPLYKDSIFMLHLHNVSKQ